MKRLLFLATAVLAVVAACDQTTRPAPTPPTDASPGSVSQSISDGAHGGNPNFFFLIPSLPPTSSLSTFKIGSFNPNLQPEIVICRLDVASGSYPTANSACLTTVADLKSPAAVHVVITPATTLETNLQKTYTLPADGFYYAIWNTAGLNLAANKFYRIQALLGKLNLGFVDIVPEPLGTGLFQLINAVTHQVVPTLQNGTVPIVFRIQNGATCWPVTSCAETTVSNTGGTSTLNGQTGTYVSVTNPDGTDAAKAFFPDHFLDNTGVSQVVVTIRQNTPTVGHNCADASINPGLLQFLSCYNFSTNPKVTFNSAATVTTCPELSHDNGGEETQLYRSEGDGTPAVALAPAHIPLNCGTDKVFSSREPSNPLLRLAARTLGAAGHKLASVFGPRPLYAWDLGVGGLSTDFSDFFWGMTPTVSISPSATAALLGSPVTISATVTTPHHGATTPVAGMTVYFTVTSGTGSLSAVSAVTDANGVATVTLTLPQTLGPTVVAAQLHDRVGSPFGNAVTTSVTANTLVTPVASSIQLIANANAGSGDDVVNQDGMSQTTALQPLRATVTALSQIGDASVQSEGSEVATWHDAASGQLVVTGIGWTSVGALTNSHANTFSGGLDWTYTFTANVSGTFTLQYNLSVDEGTTNPFGLNGFVFSWADPNAPVPNQFLCVDCASSSGTLTELLAAGTTYTVGLKNFANISGNLATRTTHMSGTFNWSAAAGTPGVIFARSGGSISPSLSITPTVATQSVSLGATTGQVSTSLNYQQTQFKTNQGSSKRPVANRGPASIRQR
jgi:hypothetical protein